MCNVTRSRSSKMMIMCLLSERIYEFNIQVFKTIVLQCFQIIRLHSHYWPPEPTICVKFSSCLITTPALLYFPDGVTIH